MIDLHQHLWPESFLSVLSGRREPPCLKGDFLELVEGRFPAGVAAHSFATRLDYLDRAGIDLAVVSLQPTLGIDLLADQDRAELEDAWLSGVSELVEASSGRLAAFAPARTIDGFAGAVVPASSLLDLDRLASLLDELERRGDVLFVHPGATRPPDGVPAWWAGVVDYTEQMQRAYFAWLARPDGRWPSLRVVFAILAGGGPFQLERLGPRGVDVRSTLDTSVFLDISTYGRRAIELCIETFGVHQLVYGSDLPVVDPSPTLVAVGSFGESVHQIITNDNASDLLR